MSTVFLFVGILGYSSALLFPSAAQTPIRKMPRLLEYQWLAGWIGVTDGEMHIVFNGWLCYNKVEFQCAFGGEDERNIRGFRVFNVLIGRGQTCKTI